MAYAQSVNLSASDLYTPEETPTQYLNYGVAVSEVEVDLVTGQTTVLQTDILYDSGKSLNPAVDLGQIEGAFVQGLGFFMLEEYIKDSEGLLLTDSTWTYKIPTVDTIPRQFNVEILNSGHHEKRASLVKVEVDLVTGQTTVLQTDILYDSGKSLNPAVDLGQITDSEGLLLTDSTWTYKITTVDTIPRQFNIEILNSGRHEKRVLTSKASGEPPLLLAALVHCATREAVKEALKQLRMWKGVNDSELMFQLPVPATMPVVKELCGLDIVESYLEWKSSVN
uniref:Aldehyde oxidase/xanthine dehydrogenase second molybdopterin binding domain-containing protein n=1 Tax=Brassica campestris TaxID=3711 RepID=M4F1M8_BRACM